MTISGLGWWPRAASLDRFVSEFDGHLPTGILRTVVPAAPDAWIAALRRYGTMGFAEVASAAVRYAREGFSVHPLMHGNLVSHADDYQRWPSNRDIYLPGGVPPRVGERFVQTDLGDAIQYMIDEESKAAACGGREAGLVAARDAFYRGDLARAMVRYHEESGGWLTMEDLAEYESAVEDPVVARLGEIEVYTCGPWCQGPVLAQMVSLLDGMDVAAFDHNSVQYIHAVTEGDETLLRRSRALLRRPEVRGRSSRPAPLRRLRSGTSRSHPARTSMAWHASGGAHWWRRISSSRQVPNAPRHFSGPRFRRHLLLLRHRPPRQLFLRDSERRLVAIAGHSRHGIVSVVTRLPVLGGSRSRFLRGPRQAPAPHSQSRLRPGFAGAKPCRSAPRAAMCRPRPCSRYCSTSPFSG